MIKKIKSLLGIKEKSLCVVKFVYDITPQYSVKPSVKNATKEIFAR